MSLPALGQVPIEWCFHLTLVRAEVWYGSFDLKQTFKTSAKKQKLQKDFSNSVSLNFVKSTHHSAIRSAKVLSSDSAKDLLIWCWCNKLISTWSSGSISRVAISADFD